MSAQNTVLITGANRGIGKGLVAVHLASANTTVIATVRDPSSAENLHSLSKGSGSQLIIIKLDVSSAESIRSGIASLKSDHGISSIDVVVANAGIAGITPKLTEADSSEIQTYIDVNAYGQLELFKAVSPLLQQSKTKGKFVYISSAGGSLTTMSNIVPLSAYGASKALGNFLFKWLSLEVDNVLIWAQHPGMVATEMGKAGFDALKAQGIDLSAHIITVEQSTNMLKNLIENATLESAHGKFLGPDGTELPW
ncbi:aflatoxin biosynthesis ketoreductase nor-1 [Aaosphaeria arxii CBS 175.79]|uniref:Aflatoxin biosynthesis ketoreductase nor-1 n=1 Tax=Aaosphaeria arxii CBS 175.79 TaxID=1450172 RepID=A0A6A5XNK1_9PLEO|nr:aflatoxin biosynthesis ketoreductase nor-1 [Aaosphaeria arxii CBS 175.79]KAF2013934.1 aflatoxin biosynthesis ketoreductase nor-1 [Aaosphaeria arxii CBS 175.79]